MEIIPTGAALGAEIRGVDGRRMNDDTARAILEALWEHSVVILRNQEFTPAQQVAFAASFGELKALPFSTVEPEYPQLYVISNVKKDGKAIGATDSGRYWHTDGAHTPAPYPASILYAAEVPVVDGKVLGNTLYGSAGHAYDTLPEAMKKRIAKLSAVHDADYRRRVKAIADNRLDQMEAEQLKFASTAPRQVHPLVRPHPVTGRPCLFVAEGYTSEIVGMPEAESRALIDELCAHCTKPDNIYAHNWRVGDVVMWDNSSCTHRATFDYPPETRRLMRRATVSRLHPQFLVEHA
jgi:taurine dioxygenase